MPGNLRAQLLTALSGDPDGSPAWVRELADGDDAGHFAAGGAAWTVHGRGKIGEDLLRALARHGVDLRPHVVERVDRSPRRIVEHYGSSPYGVLWQGRGTVRGRLGPQTPISGVYAAGAQATPGGDLPFVGLSAALVAQAVGPA